MTPKTSFEVKHGTATRSSDRDQQNGGSYPNGGNRARLSLASVGGSRGDRETQECQLLRDAQTATAYGQSQGREAYGCGLDLYDEMLYERFALDSELRSTETKFHDAWTSFLHWRRHELNEYAKSYRALEFAVMFVAAAFLFGYAVVLVCREVAR